MIAPLYTPPTCPICTRPMKYAGSTVRVRRESDGAILPAHIACARWRAGFTLVGEPGGPAEKAAG